MAVRVLWLFLAVPFVGLQCVIVAFPRHTNLRIKFFHFSHHKLLPGDDTFCKWFRTTGSYMEDGRFVAILDMAVMDYIMSSSDSKDTYIINKKNEKVNVFIDFGKS